MSLLDAVHTPGQANVRWVEQYMCACKGRRKGEGGEGGGGRGRAGDVQQRDDRAVCFGAKPELIRFYFLKTIHVQDEYDATELFTEGVLLPDEFFPEGILVGN